MLVIAVLDNDYSEWKVHQCIEKLHKHVISKDIWYCDVIWMCCFHSYPFGPKPLPLSSSAVSPFLHLIQYPPLILLGRSGIGHSCISAVFLHCYYI